MLQNFLRWKCSISLRELKQTTAIATKMSLENKHLGSYDYFVIITSSSHTLLLTEHAANGLVEASLKQISKMKDLMLGVQIIVKTLNLKINYFRVAIWQTTFVRQRIVLECILNVQQDYFFSFNQSNRYFLVSSLPLPSSLVKLPIIADTGSTCSVKVPYIELNMPMRAVNVNPMANIDFIFTCRRCKWK